MLAKLACADKQGRNPEKGKPLANVIVGIDEFINKAKSAQALHGVEKRILEGKDLMPEIAPGPLMGLLVKEAYQIQLNEGIREKDILKKRVLETMHRKNEK